MGLGMRLLDNYLTTLNIVRQNFNTVTEKFKVGCQKRQEQEGWVKGIEAKQN